MKKRIAWFSPLHNISESKAARYSHALIPHFPDHWEIEFFVDELMTDESLGERCYHYHRFYERQCIESFDVVLYHLEDLDTSLYVVQCALRYPGVCVFHDLSTTSQQYAQFAHTTGSQDIDSFMSSTFDDSSSVYGQNHVRGWDLKAFFLFLSTGSRELSACHVSLFPTEALYQEACSIQQIQSAYIIGHPVEVKSLEECRALRTKWQNELRLNSESTVLGVAGASLLENRVLQLIELVSVVPSALLLWFVMNREEYAIARDVVARVEAYNGRKLPVKISFCVGYQMLSQQVAALDAFVFLSNAPEKGVGLGLYESLSVGVPLILANCRLAAELPESLCTTIGANPKRDEFINYLQLVSGTEELSHRIDLLQEYSRSFCFPTQIIKELDDIFEYHLEELRGFSFAQETIFTAAKRQLIARSCENRQADNFNELFERALKDFWGRYG